MQTVINYVIGSDPETKGALRVLSGGIWTERPITKGDFLAQLDAPSEPNAAAPASMVGVGVWNNAVMGRLGIPDCTTVADFELLYQGTELAAYTVIEPAPADVATAEICWGWLGQTQTWTRVVIDASAPGVDRIIAGCGDAQLWVPPVPAPTGIICGFQRMTAVGNGVLTEFVFGPYVLDRFWGAGNLVELSS